MGDIQHFLILLSHYKPGDFVISAIIPQEKHSRIGETMKVIVHFQLQAQNLLQAGSPLTGDESMCCRGRRTALPGPSTHRDCLPQVFSFSTTRTSSPLFMSPFLNCGTYCFNPCFCITKEFLKKWILFCYWFKNLNNLLRSKLF